MEVSDGCRDLFPVIYVCWICAVEVEMLLLRWVTAEACCTMGLGLGLHQYKTTWYFLRMLEGKVIYLSVLSLKQIFVHIAEV